MTDLMTDEVPPARIADAVGTLTWVHSAATMHNRCRAMAQAMSDARLDMPTHYAVTANNSLAVLSPFNSEGSGADVVRCYLDFSVADDRSGAT